MKKVALAAMMAMAACGQVPGPSVPMQAGHNLHSARSAVQACSTNAYRGGNVAVAGGYVTGIILAGVIVGPLVVASTEDDIRASGEVDSVDRCLSKRGFQRRDLTEGEIFWLNNSYPSEREQKLDHLIGGGTLETFGRPSA